MALQSGLGGYAPAVRLGGPERSVSFEGSGPPAFNTVPTNIVRPGTRLLDLYPYAAAAYSTRLLRAAYNGACVKLRRSTDNVELDFGFLNGWVDTAAITTWLGGATGYVTTWYDQSGNGFNALQTVAAQQPSIAVSSINSLPALVFDGLQQRVDATTAQVIQPLTITSVIQLSGTGGRRAVSGVLTSTALLSNGVSWRLIASAPALDVGAIDMNPHVLSAIANGASSTVAVDATVGTGTTGTNTLDGVRIGAQSNGAQVWQGPIAEVVVWPVSLSTRAAVVTNERSAFGI